MIVPQFTFDTEVNAYLSEAITIDEQAMAHVELSIRGPVVVQKRENDGGYANYGMTPESGDRFEINHTCNSESIIRLATPVEVTKCYILN